MGIIIQNAENLAQSDLGKKVGVFGRDLQKVNKSGPGAEVFVIPLSYDDETYIMTLHASWNEIYANKNLLVYAVHEYESSGGTPVLHPMYLFDLSKYEGTYSATFIQYNAETSARTEVITFTASSADADLTYED